MNNVFLRRLWFAVHFCILFIIIRIQAVTNESDVGLLENDDNHKNNCISVNSHTNTNKKNGNYCKDDDNRNGDDDDTRTTSSSSSRTNNSYLDIARQLKAPVPTRMSNGETEDLEFWESNCDILSEAWKEWEFVHNDQLPNLTKNLHTIIDDQFQSLMKDVKKGYSNIRNTMMKMLMMESRGSGSSHNILQSLISPVVTPIHDSNNEIYQFQFMKPEHIILLRKYIDMASYNVSNIPSRRPNGMNRYGLILDPPPPIVPGAANIKEVQQFLQDVIEEYIRPLGRLLFPRYIQQNGADDQESYVFTIRYNKNDKDIKLNEHSDASSITLNINLNLPNESYTGSSLYFIKPTDEEEVGYDLMGSTTKDYKSYDDNYNASKKITIEHFKPGMALLHRGMIKHAALPINEGERINMIIWLFGKDGYVRVAPYGDDEIFEKVDDREEQKCEL